MALFLQHTTSNAYNYQVNILLNYHPNYIRLSKMARSSSAIILLLLLPLVAAFDSIITPTITTLPKVDKDLIEFALNLEYLEAEFFSYGSMGKGLDQIQPNLTGGGPKPIGVRIANLTPYIRNIMVQFAYQEVGHIRSNFQLPTLLFLVANCSFS